MPAASGPSSAVLACVCGGSFKEGDRVTYTGHAFPPGRTVGTILGGTKNGFLNVEWDEFSTGHTGNCKLTTCGSCSESPVKSRWFTSCQDLATGEPASSPPLPSSSVATLKESQSDQLAHREAMVMPTARGPSPAVLACVCDGAFKEGDRVRYTGHAFPLGRTFGTILGGTGNGFLNVEWDKFVTGHDGNCKLTTCGSCSESLVKSRWFTACNDLVTEDSETMSAGNVSAAAVAAP